MSQKTYENLINTLKTELQEALDTGESFRQATFLPLPYRVRKEKEEIFFRYVFVVETLVAMRTFLVSVFESSFFALQQDGIALSAEPRDSSAVNEAACA
jgi:hypothetical protein